MHSDSRLKWPQRLADISQALANSPRKHRNHLLEQIWGLLHTALSHYAHLHASRMGSIDPDTHADLVSQKASDLMRRADTGEWRPFLDAPGRIAAFVSTTARNGLVDELRRQGRVDLVEFAESSDDPDKKVPTMVLTDTSPSPQQTVERSEFVDGLIECFRGLKRRSRTILFFRLFYDMNSRSIADHPEVNCSANTVDVALLRAREKLSACMADKGFETKELPQGTFGALWREFRVNFAQDPGSDHES